MADPLPDAALDQLFREARSVKAFQDRPVSDDQLRAIWDLMKMGPTASNLLPARIVWCKSAEAKERLAAHAAEGNKAKVTGAPVCAVVAMDVDFHEQIDLLAPHMSAMKERLAANPAGRETGAIRNSSLQGGYLILAARAVGLDCCPMSGFDNAALDADFFADRPGWRSNFICSIGYGDTAGLHPRAARPDFDAFNLLL